MNGYATLPTLHAGVYQHYKGPLYLVLGFGHDANHDGRDVVVYVGLELDAAKPGPRLAVRTAADFLADVNPRSGNVCPGGSVCDDDPCRPRFRYLGPSYEPAASAEADAHG